MVLEPDDRGRVEFLRDRADDLVVVLEDLCLQPEDEPERARQVRDVQWLVFWFRTRRPRSSCADGGESSSADRRAVAASQPPAWPTFELSGLPSAAAMNRSASTRARVPRRAGSPRRRAVTSPRSARFPAAPWAYGQPPCRGRAVEAAHARLEATTTLARAGHACRGSGATVQLDAAPCRVRERRDLPRHAGADRFAEAHLVAQLEQPCATLTARCDRPRRCTAAEGGRDVAARHQPRSAAREDGLECRSDSSTVIPMFFSVKASWRP